MKHGHVSCYVVFIQQNAFSTSDLFPLFPTQKYVKVRNVVIDIHTKF